ncbi:MAG TPA: sugar ABC transporter permease, partial [Burkholderiaceae bacterium]
PPSFQLLSSGFVPDVFDGETLRIGSLAIGVAVALAMVVAKLRQRARQARYGIEDEPAPFFFIKVAVFVVLIVGLSYLLASYKGLPNVLVVMTLLMLLYDFVTTRTTIGRRIYALGGNEKAARLSGVKTQWLTFWTFVNMGVLAAVAGLVFAARLNTATPKAGLGFELDVIAACFIGGASASGGVGKVLGAVIGAMVMGVMNNGMSILGVGIDYQQVIKGGVLLTAVFVDVYNRNKV